MKKMMKKLIAMAAALVMIVTLLPAVGANAATADSVIDYTKKGTLNIHKTDKDKKPLEGAEFAIYKIASLSEDGYKMLITTGNYTTPESLLNLSVDEQRAAAAEFAEVVSTDNGKTTTGADGLASFSELELGYYLVKEVNAPEGYIASAPFFVAIPSSDNADDSMDTGNGSATKWSYVVNARPKNQEVSIDKEIVGEGNTTDAAIGDVIDYQITSVAPTYTDEYFSDKEGWKNPTYVISDKMSVGLTYNDDVVIYVGSVAEGNELATDLYNVAERTDGSEGFVITFTQEFLKNAAYKGATILVRYSATINENAVVGKDGNTNEVILDYNRTPDSETTGIEGENEPKVYTYGLVLTKTDKTGNKLHDAKFSLYKVETDAEGNETERLIANELSTGVDGKFTFVGLDLGKYRLEETQAPQGYTLLTDKIEFSITDEDKDGNVETESNNGFTVNGGYVNTTVINNKGFSLPETGGMGTYLFTIGGIVIMAGAAFALIAMKKRA